MPSRTDTNGHTKAFDNPVKGHQGESQDGHVDLCGSYMWEGSGGRGGRTTPPPPPTPDPRPPTPPPTSTACHLHIVFTSTNLDFYIFRMQKLTPHSIKFIKRNWYEPGLNRLNWVGKTTPLGGIMFLEIYKTAIISSAAFP